MACHVYPVTFFKCNFFSRYLYKFIYSMLKTPILILKQIKSYSLKNCGHEIVQYFVIHANMLQSQHGP